MKNKKGKIIVIAIAAAVAVALIVTVTVILVNKKRAADARKEYLNNLAETGYLWEEADGNQYMVLKVSWPDTVTAKPICTVKKTSEDENIPLGEAAAAGNVIWYVGTVTKGEWAVSVSCEGCNSLSQIFRVGDEDEVTYVDAGLSLVPENAITPTEAGN